MTMENTNHSSRKNDQVLIIFILIIAAIGGTSYYLTHRTPALQAEVTVDGEIIEILDMSKNQEVTVRGKSGLTNHLIVENGQIRCSEATCPDKVCVHQGRQSHDGDLIVCLPNKMIVKVIGKK